MRLIITDRNKIIYSMYRSDEVSVYQACCERATQHYSLGGGGMIYPGSRPAGVTTPNQRIITECLLTRSMLIKMYYHFMACACICIYSQSISCRGRWFLICSPSVSDGTKICMRLHDLVVSRTLNSKHHQFLFCFY